MSLGLVLVILLEFVELGLGLALEFTYLLSHITHDWLLSFVCACMALHPLQHVRQITKRIVRREQWGIRARCGPRTYLLWGSSGV